VYLYGEVGSGKSLIATNFYDFVDQHALVPLRRKLHFNSAMLEVGDCSTPRAVCQMQTRLKCLNELPPCAHLCVSSRCAGKPADMGP
jgi:predicted ATPase